MAHCCSHGPVNREIRNTDKCIHFSVTLGGNFVGILSFSFFPFMVGASFSFYYVPFQALYCIALSRNTSCWSLNWEPCTCLHETQVTSTSRQDEGESKSLYKKYYGQANKHNNFYPYTTTIVVIANSSRNVEKEQTI